MSGEAESKQHSTTVALAEVFGEARPTETPLAVDLDGTLIHTDILWESLIALLKQNIFSIFLLPFWLRKGKAYVKYEIAKRVSLDVSVLPYNEEFVMFLREEWKNGRTVVLTTGADSFIAQQIADHLGIFSEVLASTSDNNLTGKRKAKALRDKFGNRGFEYAGNETADLKVWADSCGAIVVNAPERLVLKVKKIVRLSRSFQKKPRRVSAFIRVIRPKH
jgi:phosphoserine phosphatase